MLRPNLRGIPASQMMPSWCGWKLKNSEYKKLLFRVPWRRNWVAQLYSNDFLDVAISRSGNAHLLVKRSEAKVQQVKPNRRLRPLASIAFSVVFVLLAVGLPWVDSLREVGSSTGKKVPESAASKDLCEEVFNEPEKHIEESLTNPTASSWNIQFGAELIIGGVSSQIARISCGLSTKQFRVTKHKFAGTWQVTKSVQLEN